MLNDLFADEEHFSLPGGGDLIIYRRWLSVEEASCFKAALLETVTWDQPQIRIAGQLKKIPRLQAWYGHVGTGFRYSGVLFEPLPFSNTLDLLKSRVEQTCAVEFNSALVNLYRNGSDSVGWHADDEKEFGVMPSIASLSLGETRRFQLKPKPHHFDAASWIKGKRAINFQLQDGDLLLMGPGVQENWLHAVPKETRECDVRINLTFRKVINSVYAN